MDLMFAKFVDQHLGEFQGKVEEITSPQLISLATADGLKERIISAPTILEKNRAFWFDQISSLEAWRSIFAWRMLELLSCSAALRDEGKLVACAPVARAGFELAQTSLVTSASLCDVLKKVCEDPIKLQTSLVFSHSFPDQIEMALYGSTIKVRVQEAGVQRPEKLGKSRKRLQAHIKAGELSDFYEWISDLAHPYWSGNRPFYRRNMAGTIETVSQHYDNEWTEDAIGRLNAIISWTAKAASNVTDQIFVNVKNARAAINSIS